MRKTIGLSLALALMAGATPAYGGDKVLALAVKDRSVDTGRPVQMSLAQTEIATSVDLGRIASMTGGGGLLGAIIISAMDDRQKTMHRSLVDKAEMRAAPLRQALAGFDVDALAQSATIAALAKTDWFQPLAITPTKQRSAQSRATFLASTDATQVAFVDYSYTLSPDFSQIRVLADLRIERATPKRRNAGAAAPPLFRQRVWSVVQLRVRAYEPAENAAQWAVDNGRRAREALITAFAAFEDLLPRALALEPADIAAFKAKDREKAFGADFYGPPVARDKENPEKLLLWADGLVKVEPIA